jgi:hypothetical protein
MANNIDKVVSGENEIQATAVNIHTLQPSKQHHHLAIFMVVSVPPDNVWIVDQSLNIHYVYGLNSAYRIIRHIVPS